MRKINNLKVERMKTLSIITRKEAIYERPEISVASTSPPRETTGFHRALQEKREERHLILAFLSIRAALRPKIGSSHKIVLMF